ncbi:MAG: arsenical-resistance protein [Candidatus Parabeggiatoa sp. nov. 1]|nr:MAG: arsenical-resistance protein [Gammaproteobacteria bacterium]
MSAQCEIAAPKVVGGDPLGTFGRYLTLWVALCIAAGIGLGNLFPQAFAQLSLMEVGHVNLVVAVLIWVMIYPMMVNVDFNSLKHIGERPKGLIVTSVTNWFIKPFTMAALGWLFFEMLFVDWVEPQTAKEYIAGMILLGSAPCTAMVFVWSQLTKGDATYTLVQVSLNDIIMIFAYAPIVVFLLGISDIVVPWETLLLSVVLYVVIPLIAGYFTRVQLLKRGSEEQVTQFTNKLKPWTIIGLLLTVVLLFGFQGKTILEQPFIILLIAIPLIIQSLGVATLAYIWAWLWRVPIEIAGPVALIGSSNFFELAVAVAISLFGLESGAALATVVGVLVEVPVMLFIVYLVNGTRNWFAWEKADV